MRQYIPHTPYDIGAVCRPAAPIALVNWSKTGAQLAQPAQQESGRGSNELRRSIAEGSKSADQRASCLVTSAT